MISERLIIVTLKLKSIKYHFYQIYAPQQGRTEEEKSEFMNLLEDNYEPNNEDLTIMMGDFNARVGRERTGIEALLSPFGEDFRNIVGERLINFWVRNGLKVMNGFY